jgi:hypothetical protein
LSKISIPEIHVQNLWFPGLELSERMAKKIAIREFDEEYFKGSNQVFAQCVIYLESKSKCEVALDLAIEPTECQHWTNKSLDEDEQLSWKILALQIRLYGGTLVKCISASTTHIIFDAVAPYSNALHLQSKRIAAPKARVVEKSWIEESVRIKSLADEDQFK